jgi:ribonucleotide reductase beta subunit family protein with ferritin-like domain
MSPKPSVFIFNAGIWADHDLVKVEMQQKIVEALRACQIVSMYKTTTKISDQRNQTWDAYEQQLCNLTDYCMDLRWTALAFDEHYWDTKHFREPLYSMMNVQLLSLLTSNNLIESFESVS